jgi:hypothetical protein
MKGKEQSCFADGGMQSKRFASDTICERFIPSPEPSIDRSGMTLA